MRVFIAVELPEAVKKEIARIQNKIMNTPGRIRWVKPSSLHITLKFLGEIEKEKLNRVFEVTQKIADKFKPFFFEIKGVGIFPETGSPRIIWIGIEKGHLELGRMAKELEDRLFEQGFPRERKKWTPHITLGRVKRLNNQEIIRKLINQEKQTTGGWVKAETISLMQSHLTPQGAIYTPLERFPLKGE
ncbi:RNA 2',3'-cyclic phosphodiesterase [Candidatus Aerophobetes bacterium]|uniref:RNA 2',3'-cyclic phosphodiesterase n=1 Tax=Aerophobetes bacterium TaxID=2030807 RepID=A0A662DFH8_UNCAE|nr:MAG: RNA 2',3'-cyclic phosphodiesterase [Candidatus Aerophobetes bacterium]